MRRVTVGMAFLVASSAACSSRTSSPPPDADVGGQTTDAAQQGGADAPQQSSADGGAGGGADVSGTGGEATDTAPTRFCRPAAPCPKGWYLYEDRICSPSTGSPGMTCTFNGDHLCYQPCSTSSDCTDPKFTSCGSIRVYYGSDVWQNKYVCTSAEEVRSCASPAEPATFSQSTALIDLGIVPLSTTATATITFSNGGDEVGRLVITPPPDVTLEGCDGDVPPQGSCTLTVAFHPTKAGPFVGKLNVTARARDGVGAFVLARVTNQKLKVSPEQLPIGALVAGVRAPTRTITVTAIDDLADLTVTPVGEGVSLDASTTTCTSTLARGSSCVVAVIVEAPSTGTGSNAHIDFRAAGGSEPLSVPILARFSTYSRLTTDPQTMQFAARAGETSGAPARIDIFVPGGSARSSIAVEVAGPNASDFTIDKTECLSGSPVGLCTLLATFEPPKSAGRTRTASLTVTSSAAGVTGETATVPLTGIVNAPYGLGAMTIYPVGMDLGSVDVGGSGLSGKLEIRNNGGAPWGPLALSLSSSELAFADQDCSGATVSSYCSLHIALKPTTAGRKNGIVLVEGPDGIRVAGNVSAVGVAAHEPIINPSLVDFGDVLDGEISTGKTIVIQNLSGASTGPLAVRLHSITPSSIFLTGNSCSEPLAPGASCAFTVYFVSLYGGSVETGEVVVVDGTSSHTWDTVKVLGRWERLY